MHIESNIFFAVRALHLDLIDAGQLVDVCEAWARDKSAALGELMVARGWIRPEQRTELEHETRRLHELHGGDSRAALAWATGAGLRETMSKIDDAEVQNALAALPPPTDTVNVSSPQSPTSEKGFARYRLSRQFSEGGLGRIWLARDSDLHREVVLKELQPGHADSGDARRRFLREAQITGQLEHPNIVPVYEVGQHDDGHRPYYTMRFVRGETLRDAIAAYHARPHPAGARSLKHRRLLGLFAGVCNAIAYAHSRGVIHRDLKPENVVLGGFGEAILLDWGLAKLAGEREPDADSVDLQDLDDRATAFGTVLGTPAYMAPEAAAGDSARVTARTDIYGLGAILFEILTGRPPHGGVVASELIRRITRGETPRARSVRASVPAPLDAICARAMAKAPEDRYASASELAEDVYRWLADEPVSALDEPIGRRMRRWSRRHRATSAAVLVVALAIAVGLVNVWWQRRSAIAQELELLGKEARQETGRLHASLDMLRHDVQYLADLRWIAAILSSEGSAVANTGEEAERRLTATFVEFLRHRPEYFQARLLGRDGVELVRVERRPGSRTGRAADPVPVLERRLQNKGEQDYFRQTIALPSGEVYLSKVELNREEGKIDPRKVPVIRASAPVYASSRPRDGLADGVVVINIDFRPVFQMLQGGALGDRQRHVCITDSDGYFLWNPENPGQTFGFDHEEPPADQRGYRIQSTYPEVGPFFVPGGATSELSVVSGEGDGRRAISMYRMGLDPRSPERFLGLAVSAPYHELIERARARYGFPLYLTLALGLALLLVLSWMIVVTRRRDRLSGGSVLAEGQFAGSVGAPRPAKRQAQ